MNEITIPLPADFTAEGLSSWVLTLLVALVLWALRRYGLPAIQRLERLVEDRTGIQIEDTRAAALHRALENGVRAALARGFAGNEAVEQALDYAKRHSPETVTYWAERGADLRDLVAPHLPADTLKG